MINRGKIQVKTRGETQERSGDHIDQSADGLLGLGGRLLHDIGSRLDHLGNGGALLLGHRHHLLGNRYLNLRRHLALFHVHYGCNESNVHDSHSFTENTIHKHTIRSDQTQT